MPFKELIEFILYVLPGFLAIEIFRSAYPGKTKDKFNILAWSIIIGLLIVSVVKYFDTRFLNSALGSQNSGFPKFRFIASLFFGGIIAGYLRIAVQAIRFKLSNKYSSFARIEPNHSSIWTEINRPSNSNWAVVYHKDNSIYLGYISNYRYDPDKEDQDFLLGCAKRVNEKLEEIYLVDGVGVYMNTRDINKIEFFQGV